METTVEQTVTVEGTTYTLRAVAETGEDGETATRSVWIDPATGEEVKEERSTGAATPYEAGNRVEIVEKEGVLFIDATAPVTRILIIE